MCTFVAFPADDVHLAAVDLDERRQDLAEEALDLLFRVAVQALSRLLTHAPPRVPHRYQSSVTSISDEARHESGIRSIMGYSPSDGRVGPRFERLAPDHHAASLPYRARARTADTGATKGATKGGTERKAKVARYRLRFMLQEFDLPPGGTIIGRSLDCHLTLEDPLVSRRHARIVVDQTTARIEDMGSRNGVRVNGTLIGEPTELRSDDRIRIGTQDFVFCCVDPAGRSHSRTTGQLRLCANCRQPYPREMLACPNCEATEQTDEDTLTGSGRSAAHAWTLQLMVDSLERALRLGRTADAERIVRRATTQVEELLAAGGALDETAVAALSLQAVAMTLISDDPTWAVWAIDVHGRTRTTPPVAVIERLSEVPPRHRPLLRDALDDFIARRETPVEATPRVVTNPPPGAVLPGGAAISEEDALARLQQFRRELDA